MSRDLEAHTAALCLRYLQANLDAQWTELVAAAQSALDAADAVRADRLDHEQRYPSDTPDMIDITLGDDDQPDHGSATMSEIPVCLETLHLLPASTIARLYTEGGSLWGYDDRDDDDDDDRDDDAPPVRKTGVRRAIDQMLERMRRQQEADQANYWD